MRSAPEIQDDSLTAFESVHPARGVLGIHRHAAPYLAIVIEGRYEESSVDGIWVCETGDAVFHPAWHLHANRFPVTCRVANVVLNGSPAPGLVSPAGVWRTENVSDLVAGCRTAPEAAIRELLRDSPRRATARVGPPLATFLDQLGPSPAGAVSRAARRAHVSREHASRLFRRRFGMSPRTFRLEARFRAALALLASTRMSLTELANAAGYADQSHLTRSVRAVTRYSPAALRRELARNGHITFVQYTQWMAH